MASPFNDSGAFRLGQHSEFHWLISEFHHLRQLLASVPELFRNRYLVVTCNDSGTPYLSPALSDLGWTFQSGHLYSPCLSTPERIASVPLQIEGPDGPAFDECYLFEAPPQQLPPLEVFVNYYFTLGAEPSHPKEGDFWQQLARLQPFCYLADGADHIGIVSKSEEAITAVKKRLAESA